MFAAPNAFFVGDLLVFHHLDRRGYASKGYAVHLPDLSEAPASILNEFQDHLRRFLRSLREDQRLQFQWYNDSGYHAELGQYHAATARTDNAWVIRCRHERYERYARAVQQQRLRRQRLILFLSQRLVPPAPQALSTRGLERHYQAVLAQLTDEFARFGQHAQSLLGPQGVTLHPLDDAEHYRLYARFLNPSLADRPDYDPLTTFDPRRSVHENAWLSEGVGVEGGFYLDGFYHTLLLLTRWPQTTFPGLIHRLTRLGLHSQITLNLEPLSVTREIQAEEARFARVQGQFQDEGKPSLKTVLAKKEDKIQALMGGFLRPFLVQFILRLWARSREALCADTAAAQQAIHSLNGAQYYQPSLPASSRRFFYHTWPGWVWGSYSPQALYAEDSYLADLLPLSTSFTGCLGQAEALYDSPQASVVGVTTFSNAGADSMPQHAVMLGASGSGKSMLLADLMTQTAPYYGLTVILDHGAYHAAWVARLDPTARPVVLRPNGSVTLNYLDTQGLPLTPEHIAQAAALLAMMAGAAPDEQQERLQRALLARYVTQLYEDVYQERARRFPEVVDHLARLACALEHRRQRHPDDTLLEAFVEFRDWRARHPEEAQRCLEQFPDAQVLKCRKDPATRAWVRNLAFAHLAPADYPTHRQLQELLRLDASRADRPQARALATVLAAWCRDGSYGPLFDGPTNLTFEGPLIYFELGRIPESLGELQTAAHFLVQNYVWQQIYTRPRSLRKRLIVEEAAAFLSRPGAAEILQRAYEQARKYNTWLVSVFQQYAALRDSRLRAAVMGNSQQFFLLKQNDASDLIQLGKDLGLSRSAMNAILSYPKPDQAGYSAFTYFHRAVPHPVCGTAYYVASPELAEVTRTSGAHVEPPRPADARSATPDHL